MSRSILIGLGVFACVGVCLFGTIWSVWRYAEINYCKPVVPQIAVTSDASGPPPTQMYIQYDEAGSSPFNPESFSNNVRQSSCTFDGDTCISARARYELRTEGERPQSLRLRGMGDEYLGQGNPILGAVQWEGPSYPHRIDLACDFADGDLRQSCKVTGLSYTPNALTSGDNGEEPSYMSVHDQCTPASGWLD